MKRIATGLVTCLLTSSYSLSAAELKGKVSDPSGAPILGARITAVNRVGVVAQATTSASGAFQLDVAESADTRLIVTAPGFNTRTLSPAESASVELEIAPRVDSVKVVGSTIEVPATLQGSSVDVIPAQRVRSANESFAFDLLRYVPGVAFNQSGAAGGVTSLFLRGGNANLNLVQIDGVPVIGFGGGLGFDFAHIPSEAVDHVDIVRGAQSAVYGSYANSGVIDFATRRPESAPQLSLLAEGGSFHERRFGITGSGSLAGWGLLLSASRFDSDGMVRNNDYTNQDLLLNVRRRFGRQSIALHGYFDSNEVGQPGPWGSDPKQIFTGIDLVSRGKNNFSEYGARYDVDLSPRLREEVSGSFFLNNNGFVSQYGHSFNKDLRGQGEARTIVSFSKHDTASFGVSGGHEEVKNSYITDAGFTSFPIERNEIAVYAENRYEVAGRLFLSAGLRGEFFRTAAIPDDGYSRPQFPEVNVSRVNPKLSAAYVTKAGTRFHTSFGMGLRPPSGFELAFTNNPALKPERTRSVDAGVEQRFGNLLTVDATYFYNRYYDLIVTLGGSLTTLSHYKSDNLSNSRAQGGEFSARLRPARWMFLTGSYTLLGTRILSLDGSTQAPLPFKAGQQLTRRPENSGSVVATFTQGRLQADINGYFRGRTLYEEPNYGASNGFYWNSGFANVGLNLNYELCHGVTAYGNLRNALNRHYEEIYGFPSPRLNFVAGLKWTIARAQ